MQESLKVLLELHKMDQHLPELEQFKVDIPSQQETISAVTSEAETRLTDQETKVADIDKNRRQHEREL